MTSKTESLMCEFSFDYKLVKLCDEEWLYGPLFYSSNKTTTWRLQINRSDRTKIGMYLTLVDGAPCTLQSYSLSMLTNKKPSLMIFENKCTLQRLFPSNGFSWGFDNFCTRRELKDDKRCIRDPKSKLIRVRCTMNIEVLPTESMTDDHRWANDLFPTRTLEQWIDLLKQRDDLPELTNRVNQEIERRL